MPERILQCPALSFKLTLSTPLADMTKQKTDYTADDIQVLEGLEPVKKRPGMYTRTETPNHILQEVIDNARDEALAGFASRISVEIHEDGSVSVADNGRGIPVGGVAKAGGRSAAEVVFTKLHAGGKFNKDDDSAYKFSGGLHGVGVSVTNALSTRLDIQIRRDGKIYALGFEHGGELTSPLQELGKCPKTESGTLVRVWPDASYFEGPLDLDSLITYLRSSAVLMPSVEFSLRTPSQEEPQRWAYPGGLSQYLTEQGGDDESWACKIFNVENHVGSGHETYSSGEGVTLAVGWLLEGRTFAQSYVNLIHTPEGGKHLLGLRAGLFDAMKNFIDHHGLLPKGVKIDADDLYGRACFVLSIKMLDPHFQGQTKDKLISDGAVKMVSSLVKAPFELWLNDNLEDGKKLAELVVESAMARSRAAKPQERRKSNGGAVLPGKLTDCESSDSTRNELFLVEGDSAGGSAKQGRDRTIQAILPLRGKLLNTWDVDAQALYKSQTIADISLAIGVEPHGHLHDPKQADISRLRYSRVIIMADADVDGSHIQVLLLTLFYRHFPRLVVDGHIYIAQSPLYRIDAPAKRGQKDARKFYALDESERIAVEAKLAREGIKPGQLELSRFKGLGEMNAEQLWDTTMNPDTRRLLRVGFAEGSAAKTLDMFDMLMNAKNAHRRRSWMEEKGADVEADI
jgi:topoisomerase-4 subunit B